MSTWFSLEVTCPSCGHTFVGRFVRGANVTRSPELGKAARAGTLNQCSCPACGSVRAPSTPLLYADTVREHWIAVAPSSRREQWRDAERELLVAMQHISSPHVRVVFDLDELRERLMIWDAGVDDAVVECVKLRCLAEQPSLRSSSERIRVTGIRDALELVVQTPGGQPKATFEVERGVVDDVAGDPTWAERFPELFGIGFVSIDRYLS